MRRFALPALVSLIASALLIPAATSSRSNATREYVVLYSANASLASARAAVKQLGGVIVRENKRIGVATIRTTNARFLSQVRAEDALAGAARNRVIATVHPGLRPKDRDLERTTAARQASRGQAAATATRARSGQEPLARLQWDMTMIHATASESYAAERGTKDVLVGIMDTGVDASHPDIAPNFDTALSRNFTTDIPLIDGDCSSDPDGSCTDPPTVDEDGHGTHVAGTVAAPINGLGTAGVAPDVTLVNIRAGQDSGFFFLQPTVDAMTYAGDNGIDVVNMSFYTDPWLYNCPLAHPATVPGSGEPADSPEEQMEQQTIINATQRAIDYARGRGVTFIAAAGNSATDLGNPTFDDTSPDYPPETAHPRTVTNFCINVPTESKGVLSISALGPSTAKADYSNYGKEQVTVSAPGGYFRDFFGTPQFRNVQNEVLAPYPKAVGQANGDIDAKGKPTNPFVVRNCSHGTCAYYQYLQGTSMASPHAVGVAALIVSAYGSPDAAHGGLTMRPGKVESILKDTASEHACPSPRLVDYTIVGRPASWNAYCDGGPKFNGFYGHGIVNALAAVGG
jgi:lantibiotic leader peptide-processing serine protease